MMQNTDTGGMITVCAITALYSTGHYIGASVLLVFLILVMFTNS